MANGQPGGSPITLIPPSPPPGENLLTWELSDGDMPGVTLLLFKDSPDPTLSFLPYDLVSSAILFLFHHLSSHCISHFWTITVIFTIIRQLQPDFRTQCLSKQLPTLSHSVTNASQFIKCNDLKTHNIFHFQKEKLVAYELYNLMLLGPLSEFVLSPYYFCLLAIPPMLMSSSSSIYWAPTVYLVV